MDPTASGLVYVARGLLGELDLDLVLKRVLQSARELTRARYAAVGVLDQSRTALAHFVSIGIDDDTEQLIGPLPTGRGVLGVLIRDPTPLRLSDVGAHPLSHGFPAHHPPMRSFLGVRVQAGGEPFGNLYVTDKPHGAPFTDEDEHALVLLAEFAGIAIDVARRLTGSERRRVYLERTVDGLRATIEIARAVATHTDLDALLQLAVKRARELVSARVVMIELTRERELLLAAGAGELPAGLIGQRLRLEGTVASTALRTATTQRLSDDLNRARFAQTGIGKLGLPASDGLIVPLRFAGESCGVLIALDPLDAGPAFATDHQQLLEHFATTAAMAIATTQSAADERRRLSYAAAEAERRRWARELHDETLQALASLRRALASARREGLPDVMESAIDAAVAQLQSDIDSLRGLITDLRPAELDQLGTEAAILHLTRRFARHGLEIDTSIDLAYERGRASERHIPELETALYRTVQEALTNATKHGRARRAVVEIIEDHLMIRLSVRDDGHGFDPAHHSPGLGLLGMRERVDLLDGTLTIASTPGRGTTITAGYPIRRRGSTPSIPSAATVAQQPADRGHPG